jgi:YegS/Rv2252/BmrU family lipid kinase
MATLVVFNPAAGGGKAARRWTALSENLRQVIGPFDVTETSQDSRGMHLPPGFARMIVAGGDGTVHAVVNALPKQASASALGILPLGTGNDFARGLGINSIAQAMAQLRSGNTRTIDVGRIHFSGFDGAPQSRCFVNVANVGLISAVVEAAQGSRLKTWFGSRLAYPLHAIATLRRYRGNELRVTLQDNKSIETKFLALAIANGTHFGAGMMIAPKAQHDDGLLDVIGICASPKVRAADLLLLYKGTHLSHPAVRFHQVARLCITPVDGQRLLCEADGELLGEGACEVECMAAQIKVIA